MIALIVDGNTDVLGAMTGKLGGVPGVAVRSALTDSKVVGIEALEALKRSDNMKIKTSRRG